MGHAVFDAAFERRFQDQEDTDPLIEHLDHDVKKAKGRAIVPRNSSETSGEEYAKHLAEFGRHIDLSPETLKQTLEVALASGFGYPRLDGPDAKGRMRLATPIPPRWQSLIDDTLRLERKGAAIGALPAIVFDPAFFLDASKGRAVFRAKPDTVLLHLGHPVFHHALSTLARLRFPGSGRKQRDHTASRWTVRTGDVPKDLDALIFLTVEELAINDLREPFHHWTRTYQIPLRQGDLGDPLPYQEPTADRAGTRVSDAALVEGARHIWEDAEPDLRMFVQSRAASLTEALKKRLEDVGRDAIKAEQERFRLRLKEVERAMSENTIAKLEKERDRLIADMRQLSLIDIDRRAQEDRLRDLEAELQRRTGSCAFPRSPQALPIETVRAGIPGRCRNSSAGERSMINQIDPLTQFTWWSSLKHGGLLIAPARLAHYFSTEKPELSPYWAGRLRSAVQAQQDAEKLGAQAALLDTVLEGILQLPALEWKKASAVGADWGHRLITGENFKPRRLWLGSNGAVLPVFDDDVKQIGIGTGRRSIARVVEWLRKSQQKLGLLTNGVQWRLIHTGPDYEAWCEWDIALWFEEGEPSDQVRALLHLLSPKALTPPKEGEPAPLVAAIQDTRKGQAELSANLGERVRLAVEHIIHSSGEVIDHLRAESVAVSPRDVYIAATRLVMRCVVVLFAEARELLPRTDPVYNDSYSLQGLRGQLDRMAGGRSADTLRHQWSAWPIHS